MTGLDVGGLTLDDLKALSVLLDQRSVTRAAEILGTTQPSLSKVLARLRHHFKDPLLLRDGHTMTPTRLADHLLEPLRSVLASAGALGARDVRFDARTSARVFRLVVTDVGMVRFLPPLIARIELESSHVSLQALPFDTKHFASKLESGEADMALGAFSRAPRTLRRQTLYVDEFLSVARQSREGLDRLKTPRGFRDARHVVVSASHTGHAAHQMVQAVLDEALSPRNVLLRLPSFIAAAIVAAHTDGVATLPANLARFVADQLGLHAFRCPLPLPAIEIAQYWHERQQRDPAHRWLRQHSFKLFARPRGRA